MIEGDELFDPNLLEQTILKLIEEGKRNFAINLANVDYLYSDSNNKLVNLNHKVLNVYGRLALLSPGEHLSQILQRAGIQNFLKIYNTEDELKKASDEIIQQTSSISIAEVKSFTPPETKPVSEFEDFRSEIGKAIVTGEPEEKIEPEEIFKVDSSFSVPPQIFPQDTKEPAQGEFIVSDEPQQPPQQYGEIISEFPKAPPKFQDFEAQPVPPPLQPEYDQFQKTSIPAFEDAPPSPPQFEAPPEAPPMFEPSPEAPPEEKIKPPVEKDAKVDKIRERERFIDEEPEELVKKKSPAGPIIIVLILILVIGGGAYYVFFNPFKPKTPPVTKIEQPVTDEIPQIEVEEEKEKEVTEEKEVEEKKAPAKPVKKVVRPKPRPVKKAVVRPTKPKPRPKPKPKPVVPDRLTITSYPSNAKVIIDGKNRGNTPYTWNKPAVYGQVTISVGKSGYVAKKMDIKYTGGSVKKHFVLARTPITPRPTPSPTKKATVTTKPTPTKPVVTPKPTPKPTPSVTGGASGTVFISSLPPMADVYMDGKLIGKTNIDKLKVSAGTHSMKFVKGDKQLTKQMTFKTGENPSQLIRLK